MNTVSVPSCTQNASLTTSTTNTNTTITLQYDSTQHDNGLALCLRVILDSGAHWCVQAGHPRCTGARKGKPWVAHNRRPRTTDVRQRQALRQTCFQETSADRRAVNEERCWQTLVNLRGSGACATITRRSRSETIDMISTCQQSQSGGVPDIKKIAQRNGTITLDKINQVSWNGTEYIKIPQNPYTDKVTDVTVAIQEHFPRLKRCTERVKQRDSTSEFGLDFRYSERAYLRSVKDTETKAHSEESMNVSDVQVSDEDGYLSLNKTIRANLNGDSQFANKIVKERIWTLDSPSRQQDWISAFGTRHWRSVAQGAYEHSEKSHWKFASRVQHKKCLRRNEDILETLRRDEVSGRDQDRAENCIDSTRAMISTDDPGDDSQQSPDFYARPRADSSAVARFNVADLEPASLREERARKARRIGSRGNGARRAFEAREW